MSYWWIKKTHKDIDVVLSSCGVRAPCFIGGIEALLEKGYNIHRIGGSSGGAIIAAGFALGVPLAEMRERAKETPYPDFCDFKLRNLCSITNPSIYSGHHLDDYLKSLYGEATLSDFRIDCRITAVTIIGRSRILLTRDTHPNMPVWKAVRMSSTIPFIFPYYKLDGIPVTDGGLVTSMFDIFPDRPRPIVALRPRADHNLKKSIQDVKDSTIFLWNYIKIVAEYFLDAVDNQHVPEKEWNKTIVIPTFDVGAFNFDLSAEKIESLIQYGYNAVYISDLVSQEPR